MKLSRRLLSSVPLWIVLNPALAVAQTSAPPAREAAIQAEHSAAGASAQLEEIVVTAQRRDEKLQQVPIAVSAVTAAQIKSVGAVSTTDIKLVVASADVPVASGFALPFIRGIGTKIIGPATESSVSTYVDNVYIGNTVAALLSFNNISRVEVLKGPQGTLFGRNATGGLISVITRDPTDELQGNARVSYGNYNTVRGDLYVGGPVGHGVKADFAAYAVHQGDGYGTNFNTGEEVGRTNYDWGVRSKWLFGEGPLKVKLTADYSSLMSSAFVQRATMGFTAPAPYGPVPGGSPWDTDLTVSPIVKTYSGGLSAKVDYEINDAVSLTSITAWRKSRYHNHFDSDITRTAASEIDSRQLDRQFSQEFQLLSGPASPFTWVAGVFLYNAQGRFAPTDRILTGPASVGPFTGVHVVDLVGKQDVLSIAPYGQATFEIADGTKLTLGARFTYEQRKEQAIQQMFAPSGALLRTDIANPDLANARVNRSYPLIARKPTWRIALDHKFGPDLLGYISYNRGFKSGGANLTNVAAPMYGPEQLDAYEVGMKSELLDHRVRLNGAAFYYDYKDIQVVSVTSGVSNIQNAAAARTYGLELELDAQVTSELRVNAGYTYLDAKFTDFPNAPIYVTRPAGGAMQVVGSAAGNKLPNSPDSVFTLGATYTIPIGSNSLAFNANMYHSDAYFTEPDNYRKQSAYELYNASVEYTFDDRWSISVWGKNLSNTAVDLFASVNGLGGGLGIARSAYAPPRTYGATVGVKF